MLPFAIDGFHLGSLPGLVMTSETRNTKLQQLTTYLRSLSTSLDIENFEPQKRRMDIIGTSVEGAINGELECRLLEDMLLEILLLKICGHMGDIEIRGCLHRPPMIAWFGNWGDIIGCMGVLVWMLSRAEHVPRA